MKNKFTPGPWANKPDKAFKSLTEIVSLDGPVIDQGFASSSEREQANANLISSAPEMLEMLENLLSALSETDTSSASEAVRARLGVAETMAEKVINKARGGKA